MKTEAHACHFFNWLIFIFLVNHFKLLMDLISDSLGRKTAKTSVLHNYIVLHNLQIVSINVAKPFYPPNSLCYMILIEHFICTALDCFKQLKFISSVKSLIIPSRDLWSLFRDFTVFGTLVHLSPEMDLLWRKQRLSLKFPQFHEPLLRWGIYNLIFLYNFVFK